MLRFQNTKHGNIMQEIQLDFFCKTDEQLCLNEMSKLKDEISNIRRSMFARQGELYKIYSDMQNTIRSQSKEIDDLRNILLIHVRNRNMIERVV